VNQNCFRVKKDIWRLFAVFLLVCAFSENAYSAQIDRFEGSYSGSVDLDKNGTTEHRDMSVRISKKKDGFTIEWESSIHKPDGRIKTKSYSIDFVPTDRENVYSSAMKTNVFGHAVPLDPMVGDPYVWSRIVGDTLTLFSLHVDEEGNYEMQEYNRTLAEDGLQLDYHRIRNGHELKSITTFLKKD
jgi:hypothetical protein